MKGTQLAAQEFLEKANAHILSAFNPSEGRAPALASEDTEVLATDVSAQVPLGLLLMLFLLYSIGFVYPSSRQPKPL